MIAEGQHRLRRVQLVNWGTFNGFFDLEVPREGFLVTGPSGSGKSSLLDALASVLVQPRRLLFNAAAQEGGAGDRTRSLVSYVRGAYKRESDEAGEVTTAYLRPGATWSAVGLTFHDGADDTTCLVRLMHMPRGSNAADALNSLFIVADEAIELMALQGFGANGLAVRQLKAAHPQWSVHSTYSSFAVRLQKRLGLASDQAQRLLHKTQSAKNLASLDNLLRDFMLDEPDTFTEVSRAVDQFAELSAAHSSVVDARKQVEMLSPLQAISYELEELNHKRAALAGQSEHLETVRLDLHLAAAAGALRTHQSRLEALEHEHESANAIVAERQAVRDAARLAVDRLGGQDVATLETVIVQQETQLRNVQRERSRADQFAADVGVQLPQTREAMDEFCAEAERRAGSLAESPTDREQRFELASNHSRARDLVRQLEAEISALDTQRSNIDERLVALRDTLVGLSGVPRERLPFAAELIDVRPDQTDWTGALERVLRPLAQTLLVPDDLYPLVSEHVDRTHLGVRLVYERVPPEPVTTRMPEDARSLVHKLRVADSQFRPWLEQVLVLRYDYLCVETAAELRRYSRAVTRAGQVRHSQTRHEKDDRSRIDDRHKWLLRSSTQRKREALVEQLQAARSAQDDAQTARDGADRLQQDRTSRIQKLIALARLEWEQIDTTSAERALNTSRARLIAMTTENVDYVNAQAAFEVAEAALVDAAEQRGRVRDRRVEVARLRNDLNEQIQGWTLERGERPDPPPVAEQAVRTRLDAAGARNLDLAAARVRDELTRETRETDNQVSTVIRRCERTMQAYKNDWPAQGADLAIQADFLPDYLRLLEALQSDRLPDFEDRFFDLLQTQSRNNIGALAQRINNSRREIRERVDPINDSLRQTEYAPGQYLQVRVVDRRLPEVTDFLRDLVDITSGSLEDSLGSGLGPQARQLAEQRFIRMRNLLNRLGSRDPADQRWQQQCLDTRLHVQFVAEARDRSGTAVDYFTGAGGLSGGERQKLVVFCLAAALRYQLARDGADLPNYGLVVLDEAFDKTDPAFTRAGLEVFRQFGFQLLLATPLKMLQSLEDYVGGAAVVLNESGRGSRLEVMIFESDQDTTGASSAQSSPPPQDSLL